MLLTFVLFSLAVQENAAQKDLSQINIANYTSCEKFTENITFDLNSVIDIDWKIFYFWNPYFEESYNIKFSLASQVGSNFLCRFEESDKFLKLGINIQICGPAERAHEVIIVDFSLIDRFRVELDSQIKPPVNWTDAVLFMESSIDFSALLVKTNKSGIFRLIPNLVFEYGDAPLIIVALKVVPPGYLGMLNCKYRLCYALAPNDRMPNHDNLTEEAQRLGFWNDFGRTHTAAIPPFPTIPPVPYNLDDDDEDENLHNVQFL